MSPFSLKNARAKQVLIGAVGMCTLLGAAPASAAARESGFLDRMFDSSQSDGGSSGPPPAALSAPLAEPLDVEDGAPAPPQPRKRPPAPVVKKKVVVIAPLPPRRPWGTQDAPSARTEEAALGPGLAAPVRDPEISDGPRVAPDVTATIPVPPVSKPADPVEPKRDVAIAAQPAIMAPLPPPVREHAAPEPRPEPAVVAPPPASARDDELSSGVTAERDCKAVMLVRKNAFRDHIQPRMSVARGQITDPELAQLVADSVPGVVMDLRDQNWDAGLISLASGQVDGVLVGVDRMRPEDLQQVWLGFYQLVQLPLKDSETWSCPRPAS